MREKVWLGIVMTIMVVVLATVAFGAPPDVRLGRHHTRGVTYMRANDTAIIVADEFAQLVCDPEEPVHILYDQRLDSLYIACQGNRIEVPLTWAHRFDIVVSRTPNSSAL